MENSPQDDASPSIPHFRGNDRRQRDGMTPPPYHSRNGLVVADRRQSLDRRANWIRQFSLDESDPSTTLKES